MTKKPLLKGGSHTQILRSSTIVGGAQVINYIISAVRVKIVALLLGPSGVGLISVYTAAIGPIQTIAGWGLDTSGVRQIAKSQNDPDPTRVAATASTLRAACVLTGLIGFGLTAVLSYHLSYWTFDTPNHTWAFLVLGTVVFLNIVTGAEQALILGSRRVWDFARVSVISALTGTATAGVIYYTFGAEGIVAALVATAAIHYGISTWFAMRIVSEKSLRKNWATVISESKPLFALGSAFMYRALLATLAAIIIRTFILKSIGLEAIGYYQAAWALSVLFANFILTAMGADFLPRLTVASDDNEICTRLVNEQTEVGVLLALPGLLISLIISPVLVNVFYSDKFLPAAQLLPWLNLGVFFQIITFPSGMIQEAKGRIRWIYFSQTHYHILSVVLTLVLVHEYGIIGAAWSFVAITFIQGILLFWIARKISSLRLYKRTIMLVSWSLLFVISSILINNTATGIDGAICGLFIALVGTLFSLYSLASRIGYDHRLGRLLAKLPRFRNN